MAKPKRKVLNFQSGTTGREASAKTFSLTVRGPKGRAKDGTTTSTSINARCAKGKNSAICKAAQEFTDTAKALIKSTGEDTDDEKKRDRAAYLAEKRRRAAQKILTGK